MNNSNNDLILFLQTPRAGEWNHRYIIPDNCPTWNDSFLGVYSEKLTRTDADDGVKIAVEARQEGGRVGEEILFFYCRGFDLLPNDVRETIKDQLQNWFDNQREPLIEQIDWATEGRAMAVPRPELTELLKDICRILDQSGNPSIIDKGETPLPKINPTKPKISLKTVLLIGVAMSIITIVVITCFLYTNYPDHGPGQNPDPPKDKPIINLNDWNPFTSSEDPEVKKENQIRQKNIKTLYRQQEEMFAEFLLEPAQKVKATDEELKSFEYKLKEAFDDIYRVYSAESLSLDDYVDLKTENVTNPWKRIKPVALNVNVLFIDDLSTSELDWNVLDRIPPVWFHKAIAALEKLNEAKHSLDSQIGKALGEANLQIPDKYELATKAAPKFFVYSNKCSDLDLAEQLRQFWIKTLLTGERAEKLENASFYQLKQKAAGSLTCKTYLELHKNDSAEIQSAIKTLFSTEFDKPSRTRAVKTNR